MKWPSEEWLHVFELGRRDERVAQVYATAGSVWTVNFR